VAQEAIQAINQRIDRIYERVADLQRRDNLSVEDEKEIAGLRLSLKRLQKQEGDLIRARLASPFNETIQRGVEIMRLGGNRDSR